MMRYYPGYMYDMMGYGYGGYGFSIFHLIGGILIALFWVIVVILIIRLIRRRNLLDGRRHVWMHESALDILKERYAKGEIDREEFEQKKKDLAV